MEIEDELLEAKDDLSYEFNHILNYNKADDLEEIEYNIISITKEYIRYLKELKWELKNLNDKKIELVDLEFYLKVLKRIIIFKQEKASIEFKEYINKDI